MEFEEVKVIWNKVIPSINEIIKVDELADYVTDYFSTASIQIIRAQNKQHGSITASTEFFEEAKRKPRSLPVILVALKKINQPDVLIKILQTAVKHVRPERHEILFRSVREAARNLSPTMSVEDELQAVITNLQQRNNDGTGVNVIYRRVQGHNGQGYSAKPNRSGTKGQGDNNHDDGQPLQSTPESPVSNVHEVVVVPSTQPSTVQPSEKVIYQRLTKSLPDVPIGELMSSARKQISEKLEERAPNEDVPIWSLLLDSEDLNISANESSLMESSRSPGKNFYDKLAERGYTTGALREMLQKHNCEDAAKAVREQSAKVVKSSLGVQPPPYKKDLAKFDENNLNLGIQKSVQDLQPPFNIPTHIQSTQPGSSDSSQGVEDSDSYDENISGETVHTTEQYLHESVNVEKGTQGVEAVGDRENLKSALPPDGEREQLIKDRVAQLDDNLSNLGSFKDLNKSSEQNTELRIEPQPSSHTFRSSLNEPQLLQQQRSEQGTNIVTGAQSEFGQAGIQLKMNSKKIQLEHVEGSTYYETQLESLGKLHAESDASVCLSLSSLSLEHDQKQTDDGLQQVNTATDESTTNSVLVSDHDQPTQNLEDERNT